MTDETTEGVNEEKGYVNIYISEDGLTWDTNLDVKDLVLFCGAVINRVYSEMFKEEK